MSLAVVDNGHADGVTETICLRCTRSERAFIEQRAKSELRTVSNFLRSLVIEMKGRTGATQ